MTASIERARRVNTIDDFWKYVQKEGPVPLHKPELGPCWMWLGVIDKSQNQGYGRFYSGGKSFRAHCLSYQLNRGAIPKGLQIDHLCRNRACVNPAHLEAVTCKENVLRGVSVPALNKRKQRCPRGHALDMTSRHPKGTYRRCSLCNAEWNRRYRRRQP